MGNDQFDWVEEARDLSKAARSDAEFYEMAAEELLDPAHRLVVDFACGGGGMAIALAATARRRRQDVTVMGVDAHPEVYADAAGAHPDITFVEGTFETGATKLRQVIGGAPDLIWARGAVHHADDEQAALDTLAATLAPGGVLAIAEGGTTAAHLPAHLGIGEPGLHSRLNAATHRHARRKLSKLKPMPYGWGVGLRNAGLVETRTRNILVDKPAPLEGADLDFVIGKFAKQLGWAREFLDADDIAAWERLLDPDDTAWLGHRDDLFYLAAASIHIGEKPLEG